MTMTPPEHFPTTQQIPLQAFGPPQGPPQETWVRVGVGLWAFAAAQSAERSPLVAIHVGGRWRERTSSAACRHRHRRRQQATNQHHVDG